MTWRCCVGFSIKFTILILLTSISLLALLMNLLYTVHDNSHQLDSHYFFNEPIDVVYTWVNGSDPAFRRNLHKFLEVNSTSSDYSDQRFDDKYELKFSLRSLEKYAPWVHHVYIVTNGQIPYWLNLDYKKVTLVSHDEIFTDSFDLPSFSSPAIESHLHRIPGLSNKFIYFNDDIFLGAPTYVEDFVSPLRGFLIYLAWPLPMCAVDCPWVYVGDGQCDSACYNANCQMDGGDCSLKNRVENFWDESFTPLADFKAFGDSHNNESSHKVPHVNTSSQKEVKSEGIRYLYLLNDTKYNYRENSLNHASQQRRSYNSETPKPLHNSKIALMPAPTVANIKSLLYRNGSDSLRKLIQQHNTNIILHNKLRRRKRRNSSKDASKVYLSNSTFVKKLRNSVSIDAYGASLQYTNRIYNLKYGFKARYVPAHSPVMVDKTIMEELHALYSKEFKKTSRNRIRSEDDMQFAFSYYYYVINERINLTVEDIFDRFDTDGSGTWSDREIRTILTKLYDLPLSYATVDHFEDMLLSCSKNHTMSEVTTPEFERYVDSQLPTVSKELVTSCPVLSSILRDQFGSVKKYKYEIINNAQSSHVAFKMLSSNISEVVGHLDEIRRHTKKFVCLNDNMDDSKVEENELIRAVLYDFYLSLFPKPSKFELPVDFRNRFLYINELNQWKSYHFKLKICTYFCVFVLCYVSYCNLCKRRILHRFVNKLFC